MQSEHLSQLFYHNCSNDAETLSASRKHCSPAAGCASLHQHGLNLKVGKVLLKFCSLGIGPSGQIAYKSIPAISTQLQAEFSLRRLATEHGML